MNFVSHDDDRTAKTRSLSLSVCLIACSMFGLFVSPFAREREKTFFFAPFLNAAEPTSLEGMNYLCGCARSIDMVCSLRKDTRAIFSLVVACLDHWRFLSRWGPFNVRLN